MQTFDCWDVVFIENFTQLNECPQRNKWLVIIQVEERWVKGFVITSQVPRFALKKESLQPCYAPLSVNEHPFLRYDSFVDCTIPFLVYLAQYPALPRSGRVSHDAAIAIVAAAQACPRIQKKTKAYIKELPLP